MKITQKGFSLIELMVVVAIIGILATVAVPQVNKFMAKAKQAEAKSTLSAIYTAEKAFYTEYNMYISQFRAIGFSPEGRVRYVGGFVSAVSAICPAAIAGCTAGPSDIKSYCSGGTAPCEVAPEGMSATASGASTPNTTDFVAAVGSNIFNSTNEDIWTINQNKLIQQTSNGIP